MQERDTDARAAALGEALSAWSGALGPEHVRADAVAVARYARTTAPRGAAPGAVLYPSSTEEVRRVVEIAARFRAPLHPISRGRNWGYGDATPPGDGQVIVDLRRMNRIIKVDPLLAYAVIEAGVTQGQLHDHLREHHPDLWMDATGAGRDASLVGNTLDRGFGHTPVGDHFANTCGMEVVLADGRVLQTGFGHFPGAAATHVFPYGVGPVLDGLFSQSSLGIVTRAGVWLMPRPDAFAAFFVAAPRDDDLLAIVERLVPLRLSGMLRSAIHIANDLRVVSSRISYPFGRTGGATPIPDALRAELRREVGCGAWNVSGGIYGDAAAVASARAMVRAVCRGYRVVFLDDRKLALAKRLTAAAGRFGLARRQAELLRLVEPAYGLLKGVPSDEFLRGVLWQVPPRELQDNPSLDPLDHHVGLVWISPVVPACGAHAERVVRFLRPIYHRHGFDFLVTFTIITERALCCVTNLTFDRRDAGQRDRAATCYEEAIDALLGAGYPPYRTGPGGYAKLRRAGDVYWQVCAQIKEALDPQRLISPGRYIE